MLKSNCLWEHLLTTSLVFGKCFFCCPLTFVFILVQLICYLTFSVVFLALVICILENRFLIILNIFVQFQTILHVVCHCLVGLLNKYMASVKHAPAVEQCFQ